jgi:hypothetical protein
MQFLNALQKNITDVAAGVAGSVGEGVRSAGRATMSVANTALGAIVDGEDDGGDELDLLTDGSQRVMTRWVNLKRETWHRMLTSDSSSDLGLALAPCELRAVLRISNAER